MVDPNWVRKVFQLSSLLIVTKHKVVGSRKISHSRTVRPFAEHKWEEKDESISKRLVKMNC
jgi:hypothetical protein